MLLGIFKETLYRTLALVKVVMHYGIHLNVRALLQYLAELRLVVKFHCEISVQIKLFKDGYKILHIFILIISPAAHS